MKAISRVRGHTKQSSVSELLEALQSFRFFLAGDLCIYDFLFLILLLLFQTGFLLRFSLGLEVDLSQKFGGLLGLLAFQLNYVDAFKPLVGLVAHIDVLLTVTVDGRRLSFILHLSGQLVHRFG